MILSFARQQPYVPGSTTRAQGALPLWWFLLPSLESSIVEVIGEDTPTTRGLDELPVRRCPVSDVEPGFVYVTSAGADDLADVLRGERTVVVEAAVSPQELDGRPALWIPAGVSRAPEAGQRLRRVGRRLLRRLTGVPTTAAAAAEGTARDPTVHTASATHTVIFPGGGVPVQPPAYVQTAASAHGYDLQDRRWWVVPPRGYRQQKVLFMTAADQSGGVPVAVKVAQDRVVNPRLDNEYLGLRHVWDHGLVEPRSIPQPLFRDRHAGLSVIGEEAVDGGRFSDGCDASVRHPRALQVVDWVDQLGRRSAHPVPGTQMGEALSDLAGRFSGIYGVEDVSARLHRDAELVGGAAVLPAVFGHGDLGFWNTVVRPDGTVVICDWENAEPSSPPLWDLVYFIQTYGAWAADRRGTRYTPTVFQQQMLDPASSWSRWLWRAASAHAAAIDLPDELVRPLARASWAFLAVKEATRLHPSKLSRGRYIRILRASCTTL